MKKIIAFIALALAVSTATFAATNDNNKTAKAGKSIARQENTQ